MLEWLYEFPIWCYFSVWKKDLLLMFCLTNKKGLKCTGKRSVWCNKKINTWSSSLVPGTELLKTLGIPWMRMSIVGQQDDSSERWAKIVPGWGLVTRRTNRMIRGSEFSAPTLFQVQRRGGAWDWVPSPSTNVLINCTYKVKAPKQWSLGILQVGEHTHGPGGWHTATPCGRKLLCSGPFWASNYVHLHVAFICSLHDKL